MTKCISLMLIRVPQCIEYFRRRMESSRISFSSFHQLQRNLSRKQISEQNTTNASVLLWNFMSSSTIVSSFYYSKVRMWQIFPTVPTICGMQQINTLCGQNSVQMSYIIAVTKVLWRNTCLTVMVCSRCARRRGQIRLVVNDIQTKYRARCCSKDMQRKEKVRRITLIILRLIVKEICYYSMRGSVVVVGQLIVQHSYLYIQTNIKRGQHQHCQRGWGIIRKGMEMGLIEQGFTLQMDACLCW